MHLSILGQIGNLTRLSHAFSHLAKLAWHTPIWERVFLGFLLYGVLSALLILALRLSKGQNWQDSRLTILWLAMKTVLKLAYLVTLIIFAVIALVIRGILSLPTWSRRYRIRRLLDEEFGIPQSGKLHLRQYQILVDRRLTRLALHLQLAYDRQDEEHHREITINGQLLAKDLTPSQACLRDRLQHKQLSQNQEADRQVAQAQQEFVAAHRLAMAANFPCSDSYIDYLPNKRWIRTQGR